MILAYFGDRDAVIFGSFLLMFAAVLFLWFVGTLRSCALPREASDA